MARIIRLIVIWNANLHSYTDKAYDIICLNRISNFQLTHKFCFETEDIIVQPRSVLWYCLHLHIKISEWIMFPVFPCVCVFMCMWTFILIVFHYNSLIDIATLFTKPDRAAFLTEISQRIAGMDFNDALKVHKRWKPMILFCPYINYPKNMFLRNGLLILILTSWNLVLRMSCIGSNKMMSWITILFSKTIVNVNKLSTNSSNNTFNL